MKRLRPLVLLTALVLTVGCHHPPLAGDGTVDGGATGGAGCEYLGVLQPVGSTFECADACGRCVCEAPGTVTWIVGSCTAAEIPAGLVPCDDGTGNADCCPEATATRKCPTETLSCWTRCTFTGANQKVGTRSSSLCTNGHWVEEHGLFPCFSAIVPEGRQCASSADCSWWQDPDARMQCCDSQCTNTIDDPQNCGGCGIRCADGELCADSGCRPAAAVCGSVSCPEGQVCCGGACVSPALDAQNCGGCALACRSSGAACRAGVCCAANRPSATCWSATCPAGGVMCGESCRDLVGDPDNCGVCGHGCPPNLPRCVAGVCRS